MAKLPFKFNGKEITLDTEKDTERITQLLQKGTLQEAGYEKGMLELSEEKKNFAKEKSTFSEAVEKAATKRVDEHISLMKKHAPPKKTVDGPKPPDLPADMDEATKKFVLATWQDNQNLRKEFGKALADRDEIDKSRELRGEMDTKLDKIRSDNPELGDVGISLIEKEMMINNDDNPFNYLDNAKSVMSTRDASVIKTEQDRLDAEEKKAAEESGGAPSGSGVNAIKQEKLSEKTWEELEEAMDQDAKTPVEK